MWFNHGRASVLIPIFLLTGVRILLDHTRNKSPNSLTFASNFNIPISFNTVVKVTLYSLKVCSHCNDNSGHMIWFLFALIHTDNMNASNFCIEFKKNVAFLKDSVDPSSKRVVSSAYWEIKHFWLSHLIPLILLLFLNNRNIISAQWINT